MGQHGEKHDGTSLHHTRREGGGSLGSRAYTMVLRSRSDSLAPCHVSAAAPRVRTRPLAPVTKSRSSTDSQALREGPGAARLARGGLPIYSHVPVPLEGGSSAKTLPHRAQVPRLDVGAQLDAQRSPCVRSGGPANASSICAPGDAHGSHFRSPMSRPMRHPTPEESERQRGWPPYRTGIRGRPTQEDAKPE